MRVDEQAIDVGQLADDADRAAGDRRRVRRQLAARTAARRDRASCRGTGTSARRRPAASSAMRPVPVIASRGDATSSSPLSSSPRSASVPVTWPTGFLGDEQIVDAEPHVVARIVEGAAAAGRELDQAGRLRAGDTRTRRLLDRNAAAVGVERIGARPSRRRRRRSIVPGRLGDVDAVEPDAGAVEAQRRGRPSRTARRRRRRRRWSSRRSRAALVLAGQMELAGQAARHRLVVDLERVAQAVEIAADRRGSARRSPRRRRGADSRARTALRRGSPNPSRRTTPSVTVT